MLFQQTTSQLQSSRKMALGADDFNRESPCHTSWNSPAQNYRKEFKSYANQLFEAHTFNCFTTRVFF